jgi:hypothetical protein
MHEFRWLDDGHVPRGTLDGGIELANRLYWNVTWECVDGNWYVWGGDQVILTSDSQDVAEAFLYGLGLPYGVLPEDIFRMLEHEVKVLVAPEDLEESHPTD